MMFLLRKAPDGWMGVRYLLLFLAVVMVIPRSISGASVCDVTTQVGRLETFGVVATDPEGENVFYTIDWGDGNTQKVPASGIATLASGVEQQVAHAWSQAGQYRVWVTATDAGGNVSPRSDSAEPIEVDTVCVDPQTTCLLAGQYCRVNGCDGTYDANCICRDVPGDLCPPPLPKVRGDLNCDDKVGVQDLAILVHFWNQQTIDVRSSAQGGACTTRLDSVGALLGLDNLVNADDASILSICWGSTEQNPTDPNVCLYPILPIGPPIL